MKKLLKIEDVISLTKLGRTTIYRFINEGTFPSPIKLGERSSAWIAEEVEEWIQSRIDESRKEVA